MSVDNPNCNCQHLTGRLTENCRAVHGPTEAICTREKGHDGPHKACTVHTHPSVVWRQGAERDVREAVRNAWDKLEELERTGLFHHEDTGSETRYDPARLNGESGHVIRGKGTEWVWINDEQERYLIDLRDER